MDNKTDNDLAYFQTKKPVLAAILLILLGGVLIPVTLDYSPDILPALLSGLFMGSGAIIIWWQLVLESDFKDKEGRQGECQDSNKEKAREIIQERQENFNGLEIKGEARGSR
ncbi:hypothetical protein [Ferrovum myxofaciens]|uniref:Uncharacterized protein n=1 Tax=Ferrovum myxofaciens TaxID=416213 RepID=A0A9E6SXR8_9PROT|nr:hypothetical protein [Ferrovum myxofaciens]QKE37373.1 MAG: hypothetical protein HO273_00395 [Ferrovum myxofaciens]QWY75027.1 MAG: hypothetical protein JVY19_00855 [Ferrovum myxofaciens]QWY77767.1 MAG: hypothetical protein JZL65_01385 [Ferrovum myxofaciens]